MWGRLGDDASGGEGVVVLELCKFHGSSSGLRRSVVTCGLRASHTKKPPHTSHMHIGYGFRSIPAGGSAKLYGKINYLY